MLDLNDFYYFVQVVDRGGFTAAGRVLRIPKSTLSHRIQELETTLGIRLINRTSRRFQMTEAGAEFYRHATALLQHAEAAESAVRERTAEPSGTIRVTSSASIAQFAMKDVLPVFINRYPKIKVVQRTTDAILDIVGDNYDLALRAHSGPLPNSTLKQRTLAQIPWFLFASAGYLKHKGVPREPGDLASHETISQLQEGAAPPWPLRHRRKGDISITIKPRFISNDMIALKQGACAGLGIVALPAYVCRAELKSGQLRRVLPDWIARDSQVTALLPPHRSSLPSVRALLDFLIDEIPKAVHV